MRRELGKLKDNSNSNKQHSIDQSCRLPFQPTYLYHRVGPIMNKKDHVDNIGNYHHCSSDILIVNLSEYPVPFYADNWLWETSISGQRPVILTLQAIGSKCGQIYRSKFKM